MRRRSFFLLDAPISKTGLFGEAVSSVVDKFHSAKSQSAALNPLMPRRITGTPQTPPPPPCPESAPYQGRSPPAGATPRLFPPNYGLGSPRPAFSPPMTPQTGGSGAARQAFHFSSSESSLTLRSGRGECPQKPQEAGPDRSNVSAHLQHALLTPWSYPSPTRSPVLAIPDVVLRADSSSVSAPLGDSDQAGPALLASGQDLASSARDLESVGIAHLGPLTLFF